MQELENEFFVGDKVYTYVFEELSGVIGVVRGVYEDYCVVDFSDNEWLDWRIEKKNLFHQNPKRETIESMQDCPACSKPEQSKQISIERVGDLTSVTISGNLTKDDVQSILNLIF